MAYSFSQLETLWRQAGGSAATAPTAAAVALAESRGIPTAANPSSATGLWQVETSAHPQYTSQQLSNPLENAKAAVAISSNGTDWSPWATFTSGAYKAYLPKLSQSQILQQLGVKVTPQLKEQLSGNGKLQQYYNELANAHGLPQPFNPSLASTIFQDVLFLAAPLAAAALPEEGSAAAATAAGGGGAGAGSGLGTLADVIAGGGVAAAIAWLFGNWLRVVEFLGGVVMVAYGLVLLGKVGMAEG